MQIRQFIAEHAGIVTIIALVVAAAAAGLAVWQTFGGSEQSTSDLYFYDTASDRIFVAASDRLPPIPAPGADPQADQATGYRVRLFTCGQCPDHQRIIGASRAELEEMGVFIGWLEMYTDEAKATLERMRDTEAQTLGQELQWMETQQAGERIRRPDDPAGAWVSRDAREGHAIQQAIDRRCDDNDATPCFPPR